MTSDESRYEAMLKRLVEWAGRQSDVRAMVVIGSRASRLRPADEWSDVDLVLAVRDPQTYLTNAAWLSELGEPMLTCVATLEGQTFRAAWFEGELKFDFIIVASGAMRAAALLMRIGVRWPIVRHLLPRGVSQQLATFSDTIGKGMCILVDKDRWVSRLERAGIQRPIRSAPEEAEFSNAVSVFWSWALWTAKILQRGELWRAKRSCDHEMKEMLLQMLDWHARSTAGWNRDTWYLGRFLEEWVDPRAKLALREVFARYEERDLWRALAATCDLYSWLARETAARSSFAYPLQHERWARERVQAHSSVGARAKDGRPTSSCS
jgi:aminoglycoside 6-adenylyltransferase